VAVKRQNNLLAQQRVDVSALRAIESAAAADFDLLAGTIMANRIPAIVAGFNLISTGVTQPSALQIQVAGGVLLHYYATDAGTIFQVDASRPNEVLSSTNTRIQGSFLPSQTNFVGIDFSRSADPATTDAVQFFDPNALSEVTKTVPLARTIDYTIIVSASDFDSNSGVCPLAKVTLDANSAITSVQDARNILWRLGTGGSTPNTKNTYSWPTGRNETTSTDPFLGGDKAIGSMKSWMDAMMTRVWELGGGEYWYSPTADHNVVMARTGSSFTSSGEHFEWVASNLHWQGLTITFANSTGGYNQIADQTTNSAGLTDLADGECIYVDLDRTQSRSGGTSLNAAKTTLSLLGTPAVPGSRWVLAWRYGSSIFVRDQSYAVGSSFKLATDSSSGTIKLSALSSSLDNGSDPRVVAVDLEGLAYATGISRGGGSSGNGILFGGLGAGQLLIGGGLNDTSIMIRNGSSGAATLRSDNALLTLLANNGDLLIQAGGSGGGNLQIQSSSGPVSITAPGTNGLSLNSAALIVNASSVAGFNSATTLTFAQNWNKVFVSGTGSFSFITIAPWQIGSTLYLRVAAGVVVHHNASSPPAGTASILLQAGANVTTVSANSLLVLHYDGTNWVQGGLS